MKYPIEKYKFVQHTITSGPKAGCVEIIAISSYAGHTVRGKAVCHPHDKFDAELGKKLAAMRCAKNIAQKRQKRADICLAYANEIMNDAQTHFSNMVEYYNNATAELDEVNKELNDLIASI